MAMAAALALLLGTAAGAAALTAADKCESAKLKEAGKYGFCRLKAESKAVKTGSAPDYSKCDAKFGAKWATIESGGGGQCPSNADQAAIESFVAQHTDDLSVALDGGGLPTWAADLATCSADLGTCGADLGTCSGDLGTCTGDLAAANGSLATCNTGLGTCNASLATATADLATCTGDLTTATADLATCTADLGTCSGDLATCGGDLGTCNGDLATCTTALGTCPADLTTCNASLSACLAAPQGQRVRTGQTICYDSAGTMIACAGTGQDGALLKGLAVSFTDNGDGTITDNRTGLMWEKLSDDGSIHDKDTTYTWATAFSTKIATLNGGGFAGYTDWRLPNVNELQSLANYGTLNPAVHAAFDNGCVAACTVTTCSCTQSSSYWSSTSRQFNATGAWLVSFNEGVVNVVSFNKPNPSYVRGVRGGS
jgi:hypothetical protein